MIYNKSMESENEIIRKAIQIALSYVQNKFAPDPLIEPVIAKAREMYAEYKDKPDQDIWRNGRLDLYIKHIVQRHIADEGFREDYELSDTNFEFVDALIEAEEMLGDKADDDTLIDLFDYTPEELERLRIIAKYFGGIDRQKALAEFVKKYGL